VYRFRLNGTIGLNELSITIAISEVPLFLYIYRKNVLFPIYGGQIDDPRESSRSEEFLWCVCKGGWGISGSLGSTNLIIVDIQRFFK